MTKKTLIAVLILLTVSFSFGCGRKDSPKPPEQFAPSQVLYPTAKGELDGVVLTWGIPKTDARGEELRDLAGFEVHRATVIQGMTPRFKTIAEIPYSTTAPTLSADVSYLNYKDTDVEVGVRYQYRIVAVNEDGVSGVDGSTIVVIFAGTSTTVQIY